MSTLMSFRVTLLGFLVSTLSAFTAPVPRQQQAFSRSSNLSRGGLSSMQQHMTALKPAAMPLMDSGKAFARSGEFLIDLTSQLNLYGGALSQVGALVRNAGDCMAQAAASARFKTGLELVCDELRESATCLTEATLKLKLAVKESSADQNEEFAQLVAESVQPMDDLATAMEEAGKSIMQRKSIQDIGMSLLKCGDSMEILAAQMRGYAPQLQESCDAAQRMAFAAERMKEAACQLTGISPDKTKPKGKGWIKG